MNRSPDLKFMADLEFEGIDSEFLEQRLKEIGLKPSQLTAILDKVPWNKLMHM